MPEPGVVCANQDCRCPLFDRGFLYMPGKPLNQGGDYYKARMWTDQIWDEAICEPHQLSPAGFIPVNHKYHHPHLPEYRPFSRKLQAKALDLIVATGMGLKPYAAELERYELRRTYARRALWNMLNKTHNIYKVIDYLENKHREDTHAKSN